MDMCSSTQLFAAYHGLLRLTAPQASTINLCSLDHIIFSSTFTLRKNLSFHVKLLRSLLAYVDSSRFTFFMTFTFVSVTYVFLPCAFQRTLGLPIKAYQLWRIGDLNP